MNLDKRKIESVIQQDDHGKRLDLWLSNRFTYRSRNQWQEMIKEGVILLNNKSTRASRKLQTNEVVSFIPPVIEEPDVDMNYDIIYEDQYFMVISKSGNLPCHPAGAFYRHTLWYDLSSKKGEAYIVNRLDRETSGLVIVGKTSDIAGALSSLFIKGDISKKYYLFVHGQFPTHAQAVGYLIPDEKSTIRKKRYLVTSKDQNDGDYAQTDFKCRQSNGVLSWVEAIPKTGRLHQIRASSYSLGFPLVGDKIYGIDDTFYLKFIDRKLTEIDYQKLILPRQALHAYHLSFIHPVSNKKQVFDVSMPDDMQSILKLQPEWT